MEVPEDSMVEKLRLKIEEIEEQITVCCNSEKFEQAGAWVECMLGHMVGGVYHTVN